MNLLILINTFLILGDPFSSSPLGTSRLDDLLFICAGAVALACDPCGVGDGVVWGDSSGRGDRKRPCWAESTVCTKPESLLSSTLRSTSSDEMDTPLVISSFVKMGRAGSVSICAGAIALVCDPGGVDDGVACGSSSGGD
jgi:hypothetical protein